MISSGGVRGKPSLVASAVLQGFYVIKMLLKYHGCESLTGKAKHNQMTELEQPSSQFSHGMILDFIEYGIKARERYL